MPLCPQITNTPVTVTQTADFTVTSVVPAIADTQDGLAQTIITLGDGTTVYYQDAEPTNPPFDLKQGDLWFDTNDGNKLYYYSGTAWVSARDAGIQQAQTTADGKNKIFRQTTPPTATAIGDTWFDTDDGNKLYYWTGSAWVSVQDAAIATAQATADSKVKTFYQASAPTASEIGDIWFDTDAGFKQYYWNGTSWLSVQDTSIATAQAAATAAQTTADGKNKIYRQTTAPTGTLVAGDLWFDTDDDNRIYRYDGSSWVANNLGNNAIASLSANKLTAGTIDASVITVSNINAGNISTGTLNADRIAAASITGAKLVAGTITASQIAASTITGSNIAAATITGSNIAANTITASKIAAGTITATEIATGTITATQISSAYVYAGTLAASQITTGTLTGITVTATSGTKSISMNATTCVLTIQDTSSGFLSGGGINIISSGVTGSYGASGLSFGGSVAFSNDGSGNVYIQGGATSAIRLAPGASLGSTTYNVQVEGHLNTIYTLSSGTYSSSSTDQSTGTYLSQTGAMIARRDNQIPIFSHRYNTTGTSEMIRLNYNGADAGGITTTSGGVPAFRNASDYRLKQNIQDFIGAADLVKQIKLRTFEFIKEPNNKQVGFIAHELAEVLPDLVLGEKDAVDQEGNAEYQSVLATNLIPYLTGAIKELTLRVEQLEGK
jgi:hypothetical protein